jgi:hypothetical protein
MKHKYTILRGVKTRGTRDHFGGVPGPMASAESEAAPPEPRVDVDELETRDVREVGRDPEVAAIAPVIPVKLVEPRPAEEAEAAAVRGWGITAVLAD